MSDVFGFAVAAAGEFLRDAAIEAGYELGLFDGTARTLDEIADANGIGRGRWRLGALVDVLVALCVLVRQPDNTVRRADIVPARPAQLPRTGWRAMVDVFRRNKPLDVEGGEVELRYHRHLTEVGAAAARELAPMLGAGAAITHEATALGAARELAPPRAPTVIDLGAGAGTFTAALLDASPEARATVVDFYEVIALARTYLARFGDRVTYVSSAIETSHVEPHEVALLANVVHLHAPDWVRRILAAAAERVVPGGLVVIKELRVDADRSGPLSGLMFALNMAIYTGGGSVYTAGVLREWLEQAGLVAIEERRLVASPDSIVMLARKPPHLPRPLRRALAHAAKTRPDVSPALEQHYRVTMPAMRAASVESQRATSSNSAVRATDTDAALRAASAEPALRAASAEPPLRAASAGPPPRASRSESAVLATDTDAAASAEPALRAASAGPATGAASTEPAPCTLHPLLATEIDWAELPRMRDAIGRLFALCREHDAHVPIAGATSADELFRATPTLARLYARTHYGGCMPLLYGYPADLAYFMSRGLDVHATIDRYLVAPMLHELCHFAPERDALPPHLDECIAGWLAVHVWPEFAYPAAGCDDAIYAAPWLAQVGQAFARRFGIGPIVRAHAGAVAWRDALPAAYVDELERVAWADWDARGTLHFLSDTFDPEPWLELVFGANATDVVRAPIGEGAAGVLRGSGALVGTGGRAFAIEDAAFDRAIVGDALRAMCLATERVDGSFRTRTRVPEGPIAIDVPADPTRARVSVARATEHDVQPPRYWLPPAVASAIRARGHAGYELYVGSVEAIPAVVATLCDGTPPRAFSLVPRPIGDTG